MESQHFSDCVRVSIVGSEIPQGSVLGPVMFVIYIDLPETALSDVFLFADDTKLYREICSIADTEAIQTDIDALHNWSDGS